MVGGWNDERFVLEDADEPVELTPYDFTEFAVNHKGKSIDLMGRPWLFHPYNLPFSKFAGDEELRRKMLLVFGRQCEKSTSIGNMLISWCNLIPYFRALYVTASDPQMREFSDERLKVPIEDSDILQSLAGRGESGMGPRQTQNVMTKRWSNQSKIVLRSVFRGADRVRGISSDGLGLDELQDVYVEDIPVIEEILFACELEDGPISIYSGTPKTFDNSLELFWGRYSTQNEWATRCSRCRHWNVTESENIFEHGLGCSKCDKLLDPINDGEWIRHGAADSEWEGFRVPQPVVLHVHRHRQKIFEQKWKALLLKKKRYPRGKFENEVMARSWDAGSKPVTYSEVRRCALPSKRFIEFKDGEVHMGIPESLRSTQTWAGIDWGAGDTAFTVLSIWTYDQSGRFQLLYGKKYEGEEANPIFYEKDIIRKLQAMNISRIGTDWGFGFHINPKLIQAFGVRRVFQYSHTGRQAAKVKYDQHRNVFMCHRSRVLQDCFELIKRGPGPGARGVGFCHWEEFEHLANDILAVHSEYSEIRGEVVYDHPRGVPDDFLHTFCFAFLASMFDVRRNDLYSVT